MQTNESTAKRKKAGKTQKDPQNVESPKYILALDVGTTNVRCFIFNDKFDIKHSVSEAVVILTPQTGYYEIEPEELWHQIVRIMQQAIKGANVAPEHIKCMGLSTQRGTFVTWNHVTQHYYHNFITWKDMRADHLVKAWNASYTFNVVHALAFAAYFVTRSERLKAASNLRMMNEQITLRLRHEIQNNKSLQQALKMREARVEFLDSWLLHKLRSGNGLNVHVEHISDMSSCTATGLFDPFTLKWSPVLCSLAGISAAHLPRIINNSGQHLGSLHASVLGSALSIPITCSVSDQTAAMWGANCLKPGDVKVTMGTGAFLNIMTGTHCQSPLAGMYPLIAWQLAESSSTMYCLEGALNEFGTIMEWAVNCRFLKHVSESADIAAQVPDTNGVYFIAGQHSNGFIGIKASTSHSHLVRAILESFVYRLTLIYYQILAQTQFKLSTLYVNGGVSKNDFICQFLADVSQLLVKRGPSTEGSVLGAALLAGHTHGICSQLDIMSNFSEHNNCIFEPTRNAEKCAALKANLSEWCKAASHFKLWPS